MDIRESLKKQIDQLAAELDVEPGYLKNATAPTLEKRLAELEAMIPDDTADPADAADDAPAEATPEAAPEAGTPPASEPPATHRRVTARCQFRGQVQGRSTWVAPGETVTMTAEDAAEAVADRVATWAR